MHGKAIYINRFYTTTFKHIVDLGDGKVLPDKLNSSFGSENERKINESPKSTLGGHNFQSAVRNPTIKSCERKFAIQQTEKE